MSHRCCGHPPLRARWTSVPLQPTSLHARKQSSAQPRRHPASRDPPPNPASPQTSHPLPSPNPTLTPQTCPPQPEKQPCLSAPSPQKRSYFATIATTCVFTLVPFMSLVFGLHPVVFSAQFALAATLYLPANFLLMNYVRRPAHLRGQWMASVSNHVLCFTWVLGRL